MKIVKNLKKQNLLFILIFLFLLAFFIRLYTALHSDLWLDETFMFDTTQLNVSDLLLINHWDTAHTQLYYLFLHFWQGINTTPLFLRFPILVLSSLSAIVCYFIGKQISDKQEVGVLSAFIFAIHPFFVNLGFQAKVYGFVIFFTLLVFYSTLKVLEENRFFWKVMFVIFSLLAFYSDYSFIWYFFTLIFSFLFGFVFLHKERKKITRFFKPLCFFVLGILPQIPIFFYGFSQALKLEEDMGVPDLSAIYGVISIFFKFDTLRQSYFPYIVFFSVFFFLTFLIKKKQNTDKMRSLIVLFLFFVPITLSYTLSQFSPIFSARNLFVSAFMLLFGFSWFVINQWEKSFLQQRVFLGFFLLFYIFILSKNTVIRFNFDGWIRWQFLRNEMFLYNENRDKLLIYVGPTNTLADLEPLTTYYLPGYDGHYPVLNYHIIYIDIYDPNLEDISLLRQYKSVWILTGYVGVEREEYDEIIYTIQDRVNCRSKPCKDIFQTW